MGFFYKTKMRYHINSAHVLRDSLQMRTAADAGSALLERAGLGPAEAAIVFMRATVDGQIHDEETSLQAHSAIYDYAEHVGADMDAVLHFEAFAQMAAKDAGL